MAAALVANRGNVVARGNGRSGKGVQEGARSYLNRVLEKLKNDLDVLVCTAVVITHSGANDLTRAEIGRELIEKR